MSRTRYRCVCYWIRYARWLPVCWLMRLSLRYVPRQSVDGIGLVCANDAKVSKFVAATKHALALIRLADPQRYGIVLRSIRYLVDGKILGTPACYFRNAQVC